MSSRIPVACYHGMKTFDGVEEILYTLSHEAFKAPNLRDMKLYFELPHVHRRRFEKPRYVPIDTDEALNGFLREWQLGYRARQDALVLGEMDALRAKFGADATACPSPAMMLRLWELSMQPRNHTLLAAGWVIDAVTRCLAEPDNIRIHNYAMGTVLALSPEPETCRLVLRHAPGIVGLILDSVHAAAEEHSRIVLDQAHGPGPRRFSRMKEESAAANDGLGAIDLQRRGAGMLLNLTQEKAGIKGVRRGISTVLRIAQKNLIRHSEEIHPTHSTKEIETEEALDDGLMQTLCVLVNRGVDESVVADWSAAAAGAGGGGEAKGGRGGEWGGMAGLGGGGDSSSGSGGGGPGGRKHSHPKHPVRRRT